MNPPDSSISVLPADSAACRRDFLRLPGRLYAADPNWVPPLEFELRERIWGSNPYLLHASAQAWVAYDAAGVPVGRITAQWDRLQQEFHADRSGAFGFYEAVDDARVTAALFAAATAWLRAQGAHCLRGPLNLSVNEECGLLVEGFDSPPCVMMGHGLPRYDRALQDAGLRSARDLLAYRVAPDFEAPRVMRRLAEAGGSSVRVRSLDTRNRARELALIRDIFNDAWSRNYGFVPFTEEEFADVGKLVTLLAPPDYVQIAEVDGVPAAFIVAMPNIHEITRHLGGRLLPFGWLKLLWGLKVRHPQSARVPLMGVRQSFQNSRLGPGLAFAVIDAVRKSMCARGVTEVEMSWILEDNSGMRSIIEAIGGEVYKRYRLYEMELPQ